MTTHHASWARIMCRRAAVLALLGAVVALVVPVARPRLRPHCFARDYTIAADNHGRYTCTCGSLQDDACHRRPDQAQFADVARLATGERDED